MPWVQNVTYFHAHIFIDGTMNQTTKKGENGAAGSWNNGNSCGRFSSVALRDCSSQSIWRRARAKSGACAAFRGNACKHEACVMGAMCHATPLRNAFCHARERRPMQNGNLGLVCTSGTHMHTHGHTRTRIHTHTHTHTHARSPLRMPTHILK